MSDTDSLGRPEVKVFARFARVCPLEIVLESIEKRPPPEPDIRCKTGQGEPLAFELVEIIDQDLARKVADQWRLSRELREAYEALPERDVGEIRAGLGNAVVNVEFVEGSSIGARRAARGSVLQALKSVPRNFEGVMGLTLPIVEQVQVARGNLAGPSFDVDAGGAVGDPTAASILGKCAKRYTVDIPVELLAHFELHPMFPDDVWLPQGACGGVPGPGRLSVPSRLGVRRPTGIDPLRVSGVTRRPSRVLSRR